MKNLFKVLFLAGLCFIQAACSVNPEPVKLALQAPVSSSTPSVTWTPTQEAGTETPTLAFEISATPAAKISPTPTQTPKINLYQFEVRFDVEDKDLQVIEEITYLNKTGVALEDIPLVVPPNRRSGQFSLNSLVDADGQTSPEYELEGQRLSVKMPAPLQPMQTLYLKLEYSLHIPAGGGVLGYTGRQTNICDWYAFIPPYQGDTGWMINSYSAIGEYLVYDVADFEVKIMPSSPDPALIIAAGAPGEKIGNIWFFTLPAARTFAWSASSEYQVLRQAENTSVVAYVLPEHIDAGWRALAASISAFNLYSSLFGPYPHQTLSLVEGDFPDGMEYDGLFFVGANYFTKYQGGEDNYLTLISVHETAHQWWFACVGNDSAREPWLDEALATYSELLFYEVYYPGDEEWWWNYRVHHYSPTGWVDKSIYDFSEVRYYINSVYLNGALFLDQIRQSIGTEAFKAFLAEYCRLGRGTIMTQQSFFELLRAYTTTDLSPTIDRYFRYE